MEAMGAKIANKEVKRCAAPMGKTLIYAGVAVGLLWLLFGRK
jgi:hypothetical protein